MLSRLVGRGLGGVLGVVVGLLGGDLTFVGRLLGIGRRVLDGLYGGGLFGGDFRRVLMFLLGLVIGGLGRLGRLLHIGGDLGRIGGGLFGGSGRLGQFGRLGFEFFVGFRRERSLGQFGLLLKFSQLHGSLLGCRRLGVRFVGRGGAGCRSRFGGLADAVGRGRDLIEFLLSGDGPLLGFFFGLRCVWVLVLGQAAQAKQPKNNGRRGNDGAQLVHDHCSVQRKRGRTHHAVSPS